MTQSFIVFTIIVIVVAVIAYFFIRSINNAPVMDECPQCNTPYPEFYFTDGGICQHCHYQNKAKASLGIPIITNPPPYSDNLKASPLPSPPTQGARGGSETKIYHKNAKTPQHHGPLKRLS